MAGFNVYDHLRQSVVGGIKMHHAVLVGGERCRRIPTGGLY